MTNVFLLSIMILKSKKMFQKDKAMGCMKFKRSKANSYAKELQNEAFLSKETKEGRTK